MKKLFTLLLALVATTALWAEDFEVDGIYYNILTDKTNEVEVSYRGSSYSSYDNEYSGSVTIPETVTYNGTTYSVTSIGEIAFAYCRSLTSITIPNSVTSIGTSAFSCCSSLTSVTIGNSVTSIGGSAFAYCEGLTSITIPNSVTVIAGGVFSRCTNLTSIVVEEGNSIYDSRDNCNAIIKTATNTLIIGCQNTTIPNSVTSIGDSAFEGCSSLTSITIPESVTSIGDRAFTSCESLTSVTIPNSVTSIGVMVFNYCSSLTSVTIPNSVTSIGYWAFRDCSSLTSITIPNSVTVIASNVFSRCTNLTSIVVEEGNSIYDSRDNCNAIIKTATNTLIIGCQNTTIPNSVTSIGDYAFCDCSGLTSITIPNSVTSIGDYAFRDCSGLTSITIPNSVTSIGTAFEYCSALTSITIPNSVTSIENTTFHNCSALASVTIGNSVTSIGLRAFEGCSGLTSVTSLAEVPPTLGSSAFYNVSTQIPVYVPSGSVSAYQSAYGWKAFTNIQEQIITYELNGGVTNDDNWLSKADMWAAFSTDAGISVGTYEEVKAAGDPFTLICGKLFDANVTTIMGMEKWDWLEAYVMTVQNADANATALVEGTSSAGWRYALAAFFIEGHRTSWPKSTDFSYAGTVEAFQKAWKHGFANPTEPTAEFVLNAPYKKGKTFGGWYATPDFSGDKVTTVNAETTGTLYAKWIEYIPTIAEVRALADDTETKVAGVVNHIDGKNIYIQDYTGGILVCANESATCKVGDKIVAKGVKVIYGGAPEVKSAVIESAEAGKLYDIFAYENLAALVADSLEHKYFATRVTVPVVTIVEYDNYNNPTVEDALGNQAVCYKMVLDPIIYPIGTRVTITAVAGWYNGFQFVGDAANIVIPIVGKKENYTYPERANGRYKLENNWVISNIEDNFAANKPGSNDFVRGMAVKDGIMYFIDRELKQIKRVDGKTGDMLDPIVLQGTDTLFKAQTTDTETGEVTWADKTTLPYNDLKFDQAGNCLIGACLTAATKCQTFFIYVVDLETGKCTKLIEDYLWDNPGLNEVKFRFDAFGVAGDVTKNGVIMAADANGSWNVYRWLITDGVAGEGMQVACKLDPAIDQSLFVNANGYGTVPQIFPQDEMGEHFYVDGFNTLPMLFYGNPEEGAVLIDDFINVPSGVKVWNNAGDTIAMNANFNGLIEFQVGEEYFLLMVATNNTHSVPTTYALYKFADADRAFSDMEPLWYFPHNGLGTNTIGCRTAPVSVEVVDDHTAKLYLYAVNNGYASYTFTINGSLLPANITVTSNNTTMGTVSGSGTYDYGTYTEISATAKYGYYFSHWNDGNTDNPRTVKVTGDRTYTAYFDNNTYSITKQYDAEQGSITGPTSGKYLDVITLTATPNTGYHFTQWSDGVTTNPHSFVLTKDTTVAAFFTVNQYQLSTSSNNPEAGTVSGSGTYDYNTYAEISATANYGYHFTQWNDGNTDNPRVVQVTGDKTYTAYFDKNTYSITKQYDAEQGSITGPTSGKYLDVITLTATPKYGYHFTQWNDGVTTNPRSFVLTKDTTFAAFFTVNQYQLSTSSNNPEAGIVSGAGMYDYNTYAEISATANYGYHFSYWNDGNTDNPRVVQVTGDKTYTANFNKNTYTISVDYNSAYGTVTGPTSGEYMDELTLTATPNLGYVFVGWSDGVKDNPRTIVLNKDIRLTANFAQAYSGQCGDNLYWAYDEANKTISITGSGNMYDYTKPTQPWYLFQEQITEVTTSNTTSNIGTSAFEGCIRLGKVSLGYGIENIAAKAFAECKRLYDIYVYASYPPFAEESSFANYNVYLYVPCENQRDYILDVVWGEFKFIECIGAESDETGGDDVTVTPGSNDVTITWPTEDDADTYSIVITKDGEVFCTLTFNSNGQLVSIAFAPGREGNHPAQYAEATANGYRFTVTGLDESTKYGYNLEVKDSNNQTIQSYEGEFTTMSDVTTDMDNVTSTTNVQKIFRDGQLLIIRDGKTYNAQGAAL